MISTDASEQNEAERPTAPSTTEQSSIRTTIPAVGDASLEMTERGVEVLAILNALFDEAQATGDPDDRL